MSYSDSDFMQRIQAVQVDSSDVAHLVSEMSRARGEGQEPDWYTQVGILAERFKDRDAKDQPFAITERMQCFIPMLKHKSAKAFSYDAVKPGLTMFHPALCKAIASAPLHITKKKQFAFRAHEFFAIALEHMDDTNEA